MGTSGILHFAMLDKWNYIYLGNETFRKIIEWKLKIIGCAYWAIFIQFSTVHILGVRKHGK